MKNSRSNPVRIQSRCTDETGYIQPTLKQLIAIRGDNGPFGSIYHLVRESTALEAEMKVLNDELKQSAAENRAAIQKDIDRMKSQIKATQDRAKARLDQAKAETDARLKALQDQAKAASGRAKARIEARMAEAKADFEMRSRKLSQAWTLTKEALAA
jgi:hypothetical protein